MTISYVSTGALATGTASITPAYGTGATAGNLAVLTVASASPTNTQPSTPSGWTLVDSISGGGGTFGTGAGPRRITWFARVLLGSDAAPTTAIPSATGSSLMGRISILARSAGTDWRWVDSSGADTTSGTSFSAAGSTAVPWLNGDFTLMAFAWPQGVYDNDFESGITGWTAGSNTTVSNAAHAYSGTKCLRTTSTASGAISAVGPTVTGFSAGQAVDFTVWVYTPVAMTVNLELDFKNSGGTVVGTDSNTTQGNAVTTVANTWTPVTIHSTTVATTTQVALLLKTTATAAAQNVDWDLVHLGGPATASAEGIAVPFATFGTVTEQTNDVAGSFGLELALCTAPVTSAITTGAPTLTATSSVAVTGVAGAIRLRESGAALTVDQNTSVFPPRNQLTVTGLDNDNAHAVTIYRTLGSERVAVRAASGVLVSGDAVLRTDSEEPFGVAYTYTAEITDTAGLVWTVDAPSTYTTTVDSDVISDAVQGLGAHVKIQAWTDKKRDRQATVFNVGGRNVTVGLKRPGFQSTVTVRTETEEDGDALDALLSSCTQGVFQLRSQTYDSKIDNYLAFSSDDEKPLWFNDYRTWDIDVAQTAAWSDDLEASGTTLQDIADNYTSLLDIGNDNATLLELAQRSF